MSERKLFKFYNSYYEMYKRLPEADQKQFIEAILAKQFEGKEPVNLSPMADLAYVSVKHNVDAQVKGWEDKTGLKLGEPVEPPSVPPVEHPRLPLGEGASEPPIAPPSVGATEPPSVGGSEKRKYPLQGEMKVIKSDDDHLTSTPKGKFYITVRGNKLQGKLYDGFIKFWEIFNYKRGKAAAAEEWFRLNITDDETLDQIYFAAGIESQNRAAIKAKGLTPKMAQGWLKERRYEDEQYSVQSSNNNVFDSIRTEVGNG